MYPKDYKFLVKMARVPGGKKTILKINGKPLQAGEKLEMGKYSLSKIYIKHSQNINKS